MVFNDKPQRKSVDGESLKEMLLNSGILASTPHFANKEPSDDEMEFSIDSIVTNIKHNNPI